MEVHQDLIAPAPKRTPWNKGELVGAKTSAGTLFGPPSIALAQ